MKYLNLEFQGIYNRLNDEQAKAVDTIDGAVMVVAAPGTGKTEILACRAANMLRSPNHHIEPHNILNLTFTESGTIAMRLRLLEFIGLAAHRLHIHTFHGFCNNIIQWNLDYFGLREIEPVSELEATNIIIGIIKGLPDQHPLVRLKGNAFYEATRMKNLFRLMKEENWTQNDVHRECTSYINGLSMDERFIYKRANKNKGIKEGDLKRDAIAKEKERMEKTFMASQLLLQYEESLQKTNRYDFSDMIHWVIKAFEQDEWFLQNYQEKFQYVMVDEFQDTNGSQSHLLDLLVSYWTDPNVFVVGDDDQSIFQFQGARLENMTNFVEKYDPSIIKLTKNYRSTPTILTDATKVIDHNQARLKKILDLTGELEARVKVNEKIAQVKIIEYKTTTEETMCLAEKIANLQGEDVGVIYRKHRQASDLIKSLKAMNVPVKIRRKINILDEVLINQILNILKYVAYEAAKAPHTNDRILFEILHYRFLNTNIPVLEDLLYRYNNRPRAANSEEISFKAFIESDALMYITKEEAPPYALLDSLIENYYNTPLINLVEKIYDTCNITSSVLKSENSVHELSLLKTFHSFVKNFTLKEPEIRGLDFINYIDVMKKNLLEIPMEDMRFSDEGINFMTAHGAKGLEFEYVFIIGCTANEWEKSRPPATRYPLPENMLKEIDEDHLESNRRLFYVAMTRTEQSLEISFAKATDNDKELEHSQFIDETEINVEENTFKPNPNIHVPLLIKDEKHVIRRKIGTEFLTNTLKDYVTSVSHVNKNLECQVGFYYEIILRVPVAETEATVLGNAVHNACKIYYGFKNKAKEQDLIDSYNKYIDKRRGLFSKFEYDRMVSWGKNVLPIYYKNVIIKSIKNTKGEYRIANLLIGPVPSKVIVDKVEFLDDKEVNINIVDYKTGSITLLKKNVKPADPAKEFIGGSVWRQMVFTKLCIDASPYVNWNVQKAIIEPVNEKDYEPIEIEITPEGEQIVKEQTIDVVQSIMAHEFSEGCGDCYWCKFEKDNL